MFDAARAALLAAGYEVGKTHRGVLNAFSDRLIKDGSMPKESGRLLKHAEAFPYVADYSDDAVELADAQEMVAHAQAFIAAVHAMLASEKPNRDQGCSREP